MTEKIRRIFQFCKFLTIFKPLKTKKLLTKGLMPKNCFLFSYKENKLGTIPANTITCRLLKQR